MLGGRRLPGDDHRDGGHRSAHRRRLTLGRDRPAPAPVRGPGTQSTWLAYAGIALAWFHQIPTGNELVARSRRGRLLARAVSRARSASSSPFGSLGPAVNALRHRLRVAEVIEEGPGIVSLRSRPPARPARRRAQVSSSSGASSTGDAGGHPHPFSLSAAPDGRSLRITVKALGDFIERLAEDHLLVRTRSRRVPSACSRRRRAGATSRS